MSSDNPVPQSNGVVGKTRRLAARGIRLAQLVAARGGAMAADALRRKAKELEIRLDGLHKGLDIKPISDIAFPRMDLAASKNPVAEIMAAPEFEATKAYFFDNPAAERSLISSQSQALLYSLIRNLRPDHVFEIGTYKAGTTEAICRALYANGKGIAHAVDPFRGEYIAAVLKLWPPELFRHVQLHAKDSMAFFGDMERQQHSPCAGVRRRQPRLRIRRLRYRLRRPRHHAGRLYCRRQCRPARAVLCGARLPRGQSGLVRAWHRGDRLRPGQGLRPPPLYDYRNRFHGAARAGHARRRRTAVQPRAHPLEFPQSRQACASNSCRRRNRDGSRRRSCCAASARCRPKPPAKRASRSRRVRRNCRLRSTQPAQVDGQFVYFTVEPWLIWHGAQPLQLLAAPEPF